MQHSHLGAMPVDHTTRPQGSSLPLLSLMLLGVTSAINTYVHS